MTVNLKGPGFKQTKGHQQGKKSFHEIGFFTGQPIGEFAYEEGDERNDDGLSPMERLLKHMSESGHFDVVELSTWDLDLRRADDDTGAEEYARELYAMANKYDLGIASLATHLQGQCLGDRASLKTIQFQGGDIMGAYQKWLDEDNVPPEDDPYFVPEEVAEMSRKLAVKDLIASGRLAFFLGNLQKREVPVSSFVGSAGAWDDIFDFPPRPTVCGDKGKGKSIEIGNRADFALKVIIKRFTDVWDYYKSRGIKFGLESHPGEIAAGDITSTERFLLATDEAGYNGVVGLNFDASHLVWQDIDPIEFIKKFISYIWSVHHKGVQIRSNRRSASGVNGGWSGFGDDQRYWDFVYASSDRDSTNPEEIVITLNQLGYSGALTIEGEDTGFALRDAIPKAAERLAEIDLTPSEGLFDKAFAATS